MSAEIRPIRLDEVSILQDFMREEWNRQHAFVHSRELLLWQHHLNPFKRQGPFGDDELSFWGAWDGSDLIAVLGEIPVPFAICGETVAGTWLAVWKNRAESTQVTVGLQLLRRVTSGPSAFVGGLGMNERVRGAYGLFRYRVCDDLPLYIVLNPDVSSAWVRKKPTYTEARGSQLWLRTPASPPDWKLTVRPLPAEAEEWDRFWSRIRAGLVGTDRNSNYMNWRYLTHPHYRYEWVRVYDETEELRAAAVYRIEEAEGEKAIHVVEFLGEGQAAEQLAHALCGVMREREASFLGFRCARAQSFEPWRAVGGDVYGKGDTAYELPSLFQPVVPEYRTLAWIYRFGRGIEPADLSGFYVTRSDGDQDRPSRIDPAQ
ncbi:MAG: hypothetical protein JRF15_03285 [Deltaproteobacteria bacterium]|jgi:hypothetical protein|nr:hypothetical protein [Deltaproteobacteria bacterium]